MTRLATLGLLLALAADAAAQPKTLAGHDLRVRPGGQKDFNPATPHVGIEVVHDPAGGALLFVSETGALAATPYAVPGGKNAAESLFAHDVRVRKATEATFTKDTKKFGIEVFRDLLTNKLLYACEAKTLAVADVPANLKTDGEPTFLYGLTFNVRPAKEAAWEKAKAFGVEVYKDGFTGGLFYVCDTGAVATFAAPTQLKLDAIKAAKNLHGLNLLVRKADEVKDSTATGNLGVEVYADPNTGGLVYISETGSLSVVAPPAEVKKNQKPIRTHGLRVKSRKGNDRDFTKEATPFGIEAFIDGHTGYLLYASETGSIAVVKK